MGSSSNSAQRAAQQAEDARIAAIRQTQSRVNQVFDSPQRQADIADAVSANRDLGLQGLDEDKSLQDRQLKFALARNGLVGGSTQIDQSAELGRQYNKGVLEVDRRSRAVGADIEASDQDARARLIQLATSGLDATTAASQAAAGLRTNLEAARSANNVSDIGAFGGTFAEFLNQSREASQRRRANQETGFNLYGQQANYGYGG
jgi:hypothetical protein